MALAHIRDATLPVSSLALAHIPDATLPISSLALAHIPDATLPTSSRALAHIPDATLPTSSLALAHLMLRYRWVGVGWGGLITFNGTHTWCYATGLFSCTCTHSWCYATDLISCTCTHSWCYATRLFSCTSTHSWARTKTKSPILSFPQVRRPGFQFGGGLHQRKRGIAKPSQGKTFLAGKKPCAETREDGRMPTNPCPPAKKDRPRQPWRTKAIRNMQNIRDG